MSFAAVDTADTIEALRAAFRAADKKLRPQLRSVMPPAEIEFAGIRMYVDPRDNYTDGRIWLDGQPPEIQSLMALTEVVDGQKAFVLDIGANSGAYTVPLGVACGPESRIVAFEPNPVMIGRLGYNVQLNGLGDKVRIEGCALGAQAGEGMLNFKSNNYGQASLMPVQGRARTGGTLVPIRPLLDFVGDAQGYDVSVLKIDVEGAEVAALSPLLSAEGWLPDVMLVETAHADEWSVDLVSQIKDRGFNVTLEVEGNTLFTR